MKLNLNPVGTDHSKLLDNIYSEYVEKWNAEELKTTWLSYISFSKDRIVKITGYIIDSLDKFIKEIEKFGELSGKDKKASVLKAVAKLLDYVAKEAFPIWLMPWKGIIKKIIINVILSYLIDWIVSKYNDGEWNTENSIEPNQGG